MPDNNIPIETLHIVIGRSEIEEQFALFKNQVIYVTDWFGCTELVRDGDHWSGVAIGKPPESTPDVSKLRPKPEGIFTTEP